MKPLLPCVIAVTLVACHRAEPRGSGSDSESPGATATGTATGTTASPCEGDAPDPGGPGFPEAIGTLTVTIRTGPDVFNGTDDDTLFLCLTVDACFPLTQATGDQLASGAVGVWMFEDVGLLRSAVDRVELRVLDGTNQWRPERIDLRFDGEPVYCADLDVPIGSDVNESMVWTDPDGLHEACDSAWPRPLTHGPMVGAVTDTTARIWLRTDATRAVAVRVWPIDDPAAVRVAGWAYPRPEDDFTAAVEVGCLDPETTYTYDVLVDGVPSDPDTFATAPRAGEPGTWRLSFGSCAKEQAQPIFAAILEGEPDLFAFVGDNHYANSSDLDALRWHYRAGFDRFERAALVRTIPTLATWDDHDFVGNNTLGTEPGRDQALRAFTEYWANPGFGTPDAAGVYFAHPRGDVDLLFLDDRYWRGVQGSMLGDVQHAWLLDQLRASTATFKLLIDGSEWSFDGGLDSWDEFQDERGEIFQAIADDGVSGVLLLSGDIHRSELRLIDAPAYPLPEVISSPLAQITTTVCDPLGGELLACQSGGDYWVDLDFDTTVADPIVTATIRDAGGLALDTLSWTLSDLGG